MAQPIRPVSPWGLLAAIVLLAAPPALARTVPPGAAAAAAGDEELKAPPERKQASAGLENVQDLPGIAHLRPRPGMVIPNPPFSYAGLSELRTMPPELVRQWQACLDTRMDPSLVAEWKKSLVTQTQEALPTHRYALFHGLGMASQRRLLRCYYDNVDSLSSAEAFALSPWIVLGLRNLISGTLIDVTYPRTFYPIGFLLEAPLENIWKTQETDAHVPMENHPYDQDDFRRGYFLIQNPYTPEQEAAYEAAYHKFFADKGMTGYINSTLRRTLEKEFDSKYEAEHPHTRAYGPQSRELLLAPSVLMGNPYDDVGFNRNEVAFFAHTTPPARSIRIQAVVLVSSGPYSTGVTDKQGIRGQDEKPEAYYEDQARILALALHVPFYDLRRATPK